MERSGSCWCLADDTSDSETDGEVSERWGGNFGLKRKVRTCCSFSTENKQGGKENKGRDKGMMVLFRTYWPGNRKYHELRIKKCGSGLGVIIWYTSLETILVCTTVWFYILYLGIISSQRPFLVGNYPNQPTKDFMEKYSPNLLCSRWFWCLCGRIKIHKWYWRDCRLGFFPSRPVFLWPQRMVLPELFGQRFSKFHVATPMSNTQIYGCFQNRGTPKWMIYNGTPC